MNENAFGGWLQKQLDRRNWLQADLVHRGKFSRSAVSDWINGKRVPDPASVDRIADAFGLPVDDVLTIAGHRPAIDPIDTDSALARIISKAKRVNWNSERELNILRTMDLWIDLDRGG